MAFRDVSKTLAACGLCSAAVLALNLCKGAQDLVFTCVGESVLTTRESSGCLVGCRSPSAPAPDARTWPRSEGRGRCAEVNNEGPPSVGQLLSLLPTASTRPPQSAVWDPVRKAQLSR